MPIDSTQYTLRKEIADDVEWILHYLRDQGDEVRIRRVAVTDPKAEESDFVVEFEAKSDSDAHAGKLTGDRLVRHVLQYRGTL